MPDQNLQKRAGRNVGVETLPVFLQGGGGPEITIDSPSGQRVVLLEGAPAGKALRTPFTRAENSGYVFNNTAEDLNISFLFEDDQGNELLIGAFTPLPAGESAPLPLSESGGSPNAFTPATPLSLCEGEKLTMKASPALVF